MKNLFNTLFYSKPVFRRGGPERSEGGKEQISKHEIGRLDKQFNRVVKRFDNIKKRNIRALLNQQAEKGLRKQVVNQLKKQSGPDVFPVLYPPAEVNKIVKASSSKIDLSKIKISNQDIKDIKFAAKGRFADIVKNACSTQSKDTEISISIQGKPWENLATQLANNPTVKADNLRKVASDARTLAEKALGSAIESKFGNKVNKQIVKAVSSTVETIS